jgi:hypothetical protein
MVYAGARTRRPGFLLPLLGMLLFGGLLAACARPAAGLVAVPTTPTVLGTPAATGATPSPQPAPRGARTITRADQGTTVRIAVGEVLILRLPGGMAWDVQITDPRVVTADRAATPTPGEQGIYRARRVGVTELLALALPPCAKDRPPCEVMTPAFRVLIVVS